ncbi:MAG: lysine--tRNA ligase [Rhodospirillaceae bacterium]|jgi:lysyl-tRNA synthetase, class I|nr:lysine--tRNA ligase [Rhodospirillaceae bacterium]MBT5374757.1 lysine--tRNA ligase [Rhodospirillaceae bacterium]MBT5659786.1 lysine--tRNA ligase [Rhodospirillaceae bacterium]MBT5752169.1 lysine--tRNA ligase [Rhodospirillaceae bacterium]
MTDIRDLALTAKAWPFEEARKILARVKEKTPEKGYVLFETGYGPSGLPHIGTFGEVARTTMVRRAFTAMSDIPTRLFAFSDDLDGLRKVPDNIPNKEMVTEHLGKPLTSIPDPFGTHNSFGEHNNARLRDFLDSFGFEYEFQSATEWYTSGRFDDVLLKVLNEYEKVRGVILPTLGPERRATYSPFLPLCEQTGQVLQVPITATDAAAGTVSYVDEASGETITVPVTGGRCKLQWKADWAMRWTALQVDYEMSGKDLIDSVRLSSQICKILGGRPPESYTYELFLDENGGKISKSKGNGLAVEEWLRYAPPESLSLYMYQSPRKAKRLFFDVIPRSVDDYLTFLGKFDTEEAVKRLENPVWHIHNGKPPQEDAHLGFNILLNLAGVCHAEDKSALWGFISRYAPKATPQSNPILDRLAGYAVAYYQDFIKPHKHYRLPDANEQAALEDLIGELEGLASDALPEDIQTQVYEIGKRHDFADLKAWFRALYETLLGQEQGPRMGSFIALYGIEETISLIRRVLAGEDLASS